MSDKHFTYKSMNHEGEKVYYKDLPKDTLSILDTSITERWVYLDSIFGKASLKGGYDPEKVSSNFLEEKGLLKKMY